MDTHEGFNDLLIKLFNDVMELEQKAVITDEFKDISNNDMHIIEAIGEKEPRNMSTIAKSLKVTVGTLTIGINNLVKKGYVNRVRSEEDRRVVLVSLSKSGQKAYEHHKKFHEQMIAATIKGFSEEETKVLIRALYNLNGYFRKYNQ